MALAVGTQLGSHEITALLGKGGMGEVYRARDLKLKREVAIKILPEEFSRDADRVARFQREAEVLASLNHPHIAAIYDLANVADTRYLVLELVEGETLADRIARRAIPLEETLGIARQIAEALEAAHEKGIVHRDLKPANIKIAPSGNVKVLDFGLAKMREAEDVNPTLSNSPTIMTAGPGMILGTAAYMSPEQARGKTVDKRADIWAFGVILYEMLTGRQLFEGESISDTLSAVLTKEPEWDRVPRKAQFLLRNCLEKNAARRLRDIGDAWRLLRDETQTAVAKSRLPWAVAAVLGVVAAVALVAAWRPTRQSGQGLVRLALDLGADVSPTNLGADVILSPDGTRLVFAGEGSEGKPRLYTRRLDDPMAHELPETVGAYGQFFSPDGKWVGFFASGKLKKIAVDGGDAITLCDAPAARGASWSEDGNIFAALDSQSGISRIPAEGGKPTSITELEAGENSHRWPQVLPGGKAVLFSVNNNYGNFEKASVAVVILGNARKKIIIEGAGMYPRYVPSGHLIYGTNGALFAVPFDLDRLEVVGMTVRVLDDVLSDTNYGFSQFDVARNGTLAYRSGRVEGLRTVQWLDTDGTTKALLAEPALYQFPRFSPDGNRIAVVVTGGPSSVIWIHDWLRGSKTRLTPAADVNTYPLWTPDGESLVFRSVSGISWARADGSSKPEPLTNTKTVQSPTSFTPDGKRLVFIEPHTGGADIRTVKIENASGQLRAGDAELFLQTPSSNPFPALSPDGRWLAYASAESGIYEVYVQPFPNKGTKWMISNNGGTMPVWSRNGHELFYRTEDERIMVANYKVSGNSFVPDKPRAWSEKRLANLGLTPNMDLPPDSKRFAVVMQSENLAPAQQTRHHVTLVLNFLDEILRAQGH
jgi:eukaryotic-like serine/threonine-protein kinase